MPKITKLCQNLSKLCPKLIPLEQTKAVFVLAEFRFVLVADGWWNAHSVYIY